MYERKKNINDIIDNVYNPLAKQKQFPIPLTCFAMILCIICYIEGTTDCKKIGL